MMTPFVVVACGTLAVEPIPPALVPVAGLVGAAATAGPNLAATAAFPQLLRYDLGHERWRQRTDPRAADRRRELGAAFARASLHSDRVARIQGVWSDQAARRQEAEARLGRLREPLRVAPSIYLPVLIVPAELETRTPAYPPDR
jgi:hypothetical protein